MTDPLSVIWPLLDLPGTVVTSHAIADWPANLFEQLAEMGVLRPTSGPERIVCPECLDHVEEVLLISGPGGHSLYAIACPENLRVILSLDDLRQWIVDADRLSVILASAFKLSGKPSVLAPGRIWRLGRWKYQGQTRDMLLAVGLSQPDALELRRKITESKRPVVLLPLSAPAAGYWKGLPPPIIPLSEVVSLVDNDVRIDIREILGVVDDANMRETESTDSLSGFIEKRVHSAMDTKLTTERIVQSYIANDSSARKAAVDLTNQGFKISHATVSRHVKKNKEILRTSSSNSIERSRSSQRRDTPRKNEK